jgi:3-isopropylmalate/(R)-2-methylmalate dehydratase large subunit
MGKTITEKILARASQRPEVNVGDYIVCKPHVLAFHDMGARYIEWWDKHDIRLHDPKRVIWCFDHHARAGLWGGAAGMHARIREFARRQGIPPENIYDIGRHGIQHQVPAEEGWVLPGTLYIGADSQSGTMGALGCVAYTRNGEIHGVAATGDTWIKVPASMQVKLDGRLRPGVLGKDLALLLTRDIRDRATSLALEFCGPGVGSISVDNRMSVVGTAALMGCETMVFPADRVLLEWVTPRAREPFVPEHSDPDADYVDTYEVDLDAVSPLVAAPHALENVQPLEQVAGTAVDLAFIGSCASARYEDLALAASVLRGRTIHPRVRMVVTPISSTVLRDAARDGIISDLVAAGATITTPGCGGCYIGNQSPATLDDGEVCISTSPENGVGRMGSPNSSIYSANAAVVAASAIEGVIADPTPYIGRSR